MVCKKAFSLEKNKQVRKFPDITHYKHVINIAQLQDSVCVKYGNGGGSWWEHNVHRNIEILKLYQLVWIQGVDLGENEQMNKTNDCN